MNIGSYGGTSCCFRLKDALVNPILHLFKFVLAVQGQKFLNCTVAKSLPQTG